MVLSLTNWIQKHASPDTRYPFFGLCQSEFIARCRRRPLGARHSDTYSARYAPVGLIIYCCNAKFLALAVLHDFSQVSPHKLLFLHVCVQQALSIFDRWTASGVKNILATCIHVVTKIPKHVICSICFGCLFGNANAKNSLFIFYCNSFYNSTDSNWNMQVVSFKHK